MLSSKTCEFGEEDKWVEREMNHNAVYLCGSLEMTTIAQKNTPKARAARDARKVGTKIAASDVGVGAGASAAAAFCTEEMAINATINRATKSFNFIASISLNARRKMVPFSF